MNFTECCTLDFQVIGSQGSPIASSVCFVRKWVSESIEHLLYFTHRESIHFHFVLSEFPPTPHPQYSTPHAPALIPLARQPNFSPPSLLALISRRAPPFFKFALLVPSRGKHKYCFELRPFLQHAAQSPLGTAPSPTYPLTIQGCWRFVSITPLQMRVSESSPPVSESSRQVSESNPQVSESTRPVSESSRTASEYMSGSSQIQVLRGVSESRLRFRVSKSRFPAEFPNPGLDSEFPNPGSQRVSKSSLVSESSLFFRVSKSRPRLRFPKSRRPERCQIQGSFQSQLLRSFQIWVSEPGPRFQIQGRVSNFGFPNPSFTRGGPPSLPPSPPLPSPPLTLADPKSVVVPVSPIEPL